MALNKKLSRIRRRLKARDVSRRMESIRLQVHKSNRHIYAQVIDVDSRIIVQASTLSKDLRSKIKYSGNVEAARLVGESVGRMAVEAGVSKVAFDRSGFRYHGRIKALADKARAAGLQF